MKKILFLLLICFIKLSAYEYRIYIARNGVDEIYYFDNSSGVLKVRYNNTVWVDSHFYDTLNSINHSVSNDGYLYIKRDQLIELFKQDNQFLNDFYTQQTQPILNFFYNENTFSSSNHIIYENYQILYNTDGLAVESIVGGVWKGLFDTPENSGLLYDQANNILYDNGQVASLFQRFWFSLTGNVSKTLKLYYISMLSLNVFILILAVYLVKVLLGLIVKWITTVINNTKVNVNLGAQKRW